MADNTDTTTTPGVVQNITDAIIGNYTEGGNFTNSTAEYDVEETPENYVKLAIIGLKVIYVCTMMTFAIIAYRRKRQGFTSESVLFLFFILSMITLLIFDMVAKYIILLYFMLLTSNYASFYTFNSLINHTHFQGGEAVKLKFKPFAYAIQAGFIIAIIACFIPGINVRCTDEHQYPHTFFFVIGCSILFSIVAQYFYHTTDFHKLEDNAPEGSEEARDLAIFKKQSKIFIVYNTILCVAQIIVCTYGVVAIENGEHIECINNGREWKFVTQTGNLFSTLHIFIVIFQAIMVEKIFYGVPHKAGVFHGEDHIANDGDYVKHV